MIPLALLIIIGGYLTYLVFTFIYVIGSFRTEEGTYSTSFASGFVLISEVIFTIIGPVIGFLRYDEYGPDIPFAKHHVPTVILLVVVSSLCYWISRFTMKTSSPMLRILVSAGLLQGITLCFITTIHFIAYIPMGIIYPFFGFELLSPLVAGLLLLKQFYFYNRQQFDFSSNLPFRKEAGLLPLQIRVMEASPSNRFLVILGLLIPFLIAQVTFAFTCGQDPDSLIKAFTHSHGFIFSLS